MAQITLYIDDTTKARLREAAAAREVSQSHYVVDLVRRETASEWPAAVLVLAGAVPEFPLAEELRAGQPPDAERVPL